MFVLAIAFLVLALLATVWTTAYALTRALPELLWLARVRKEDALWDTLEEMHATLATLEAIH